VRACGLIMVMCVRGKKEKEKKKERGNEWKVDTWRTLEKEKRRFLADAAASDIGVEVFVWLMFFGYVWFDFGALCTDMYHRFLSLFSLFCLVTNSMYIVKLVLNSNYLIHLKFGR
jgi:hypothetical protein